MREKQTHIACEFVVEKTGFFVDQHFRVTVVAHGHRYVYPWAAGYQIGTKHHAAITAYRRQQQSRRVSVAVFKAHLRP
jgi:hypothetical protein